MAPSLGSLRRPRTGATSRLLARSQQRFGNVQSVRTGRQIRVQASTALPPRQLKVKRIMGEGSFGQVFEGTYTTPKGEERIVMKRVKARVEGAEEMHEMELALNQYAAKVAKGHCADFLGYCTVSQEESTAQLTPGMWLMWKYEGSKTLSYYMRRRDFTRALAVDLEVSEDVVVPTVMKQLFEGLSAFHAAGLVHRDVKPLNIIFAEDQRRFKLIDLGACVDLRTGKNYVPDESILDPQYAPPEKYVLPTDSPDLRKSLLNMVVSPMLWARHKPDRFDMWSAGMVMLQLGLPTTRTDRGLKQFNATYGSKYNYDLQAWRNGSGIPRRECELFDANDGAGWDLLQSLLRERHVEVDDEGRVAFIDKGQARTSAQEALKHKFTKLAAGTTQVSAQRTQKEKSGSAGESVRSATGSRSGGSAGTGGSSPANTAAGRRAAAAAAASSGASGRSSAAPTPVAASTSGRGSSAASGAGAGTGGSGTGGARPKSRAGAFGAAASMWREMTSKLFDLEAQIVTQASATERQTTKVQQLKQQAASGQLSKAQLSKEEDRLNRMQKRLGGLQEDYEKTATSAGGLLSFLGLGGGGGSAATAAGGTGDAKKAAATAGKGQPPANIALWRRVADRMAEIENKLMNQESAVDKQSFTVKKLRQQVTQGVADPVLLQRAERTLERMERRLNQLSVEKADTRQQATNVLSMLGNIMNPGGSTASASMDEGPSSTPSPSSSSSAAASKARPASAPAAAAKQQQQQPAAPATPAAGGGFGSGIWRAIFGNPAPPAQAPTPTTPIPPPPSPAKPAVSQVSIPAPPKPPAAASKQPTIPPQPSGTSSSYPRAGTAWEAMSEQGASPLGGMLTGLGGMAARMAVGFASSLDKTWRDMEAAEEAKRLQRAADAKFLAMLRERQPPITSTSTYAQVEESCGSDPRFLALDEPRRRLQLALYLESVAELEAATRQQARSMLKALYRRSALQEDEEWEAVVQRLGKEAAFQAVGADSDRRALWQEVVAELQAVRLAKERQEQEQRQAQELARRAAADAAAAAAKLAEREAAAAREEEAEFGFVQMLGAMQPPIYDASQWAQLRQDTAQDPRYAAVPERRQRELFDAFVAQAQASAAAAAAVAPVAPAAPAPALSFHASNGAAARQAVSNSPVQEQEVDDWGEEDEEEGEEEMSEEERAEAMYMEMLATLSPVLRPDSLWPEVKPRIMQEPRFQAIPHRRRRELFILFMAGVREAAGLPALPSDHGLDASGGTAVISVGAKASTAAGGALGGSSMAPVVDLGRIEMLRKEQARLRAEYEKMEAKLREMEEEMRQREQQRAQLAKGRQGPSQGQGQGLAKGQLPAVPATSPADELARLKGQQASLQGPQPGAVTPKLPLEAAQKLKFGEAPPSPPPPQPAEQTPEGQEAAALAKKTKDGSLLFSFGQQDKSNGNGNGNGSGAVNSADKKDKVESSRAQ